MESQSSSSPLPAIAETANESNGSAVSLQPTTAAAPPKSLHRSPPPAALSIPTQSPANLKSPSISLEPSPSSGSTTSPSAVPPANYGGPTSSRQISPLRQGSVASGTGSIWSAGPATSSPLPVSFDVKNLLMDVDEQELSDMVQITKKVGEGKAAADLVQRLQPTAYSHPNSATPTSQQPQPSLSQDRPPSADISEDTRIRVNQMKESLTNRYDTLHTILSSQQQYNPLDAVRKKQSTQKGKSKKAKGGAGSSWKVDPKEISASSTVAQQARLGTSNVESGVGETLAVERSSELLESGSTLNTDSSRPNLLKNGDANVLSPTAVSPQKNPTSNTEDGRSVTPSQPTSPKKTNWPLGNLMSRIRSRASTNSSATEDISGKASPNLKQPSLDTQLEVRPMSRASSSHSISPLPSTESAKPIPSPTAPTSFQVSTATAATTTLVSARTQPSASSSSSAGKEISPASARAQSPAFPSLTLSPPKGNEMQQLSTSEHDPSDEEADGKHKGIRGMFKKRSSGVKVRKPSLGGSSTMEEGKVAETPTMVQDTPRFLSPTGKTSSVPPSSISTTNSSTLTNRAKRTTTDNAGAKRWLDTTVDHENGEDESYFRFKYQQNLYLFKTILQQQALVRQQLTFRGHRRRQLPWKTVDLVYDRVTAASAEKLQQLQRMHENVSLRIQANMERIDQVRKEDNGRLKSRRDMLLASMNSLSIQLQQLSEPIHKCEVEHAQLTSINHAIGEQLDDLTNEVNARLQQKLSELTNRFQQLQSQRSMRGDVNEFGYVLLAIVLNFVARLFWWFFAAIRGVRWVFVRGERTAPIVTVSPVLRERRESIAAARRKYGYLAAGGGKQTGDGARGSGMGTSSGRVHRKSVSEPPVTLHSPT